MIMEEKELKLLCKEISDTVYLLNNLINKALLSEKIHVIRTDGGKRSGELLELVADGRIVPYYIRVIPSLIV